MNMILLLAPDFENESRVRLSGRRFEHMQRVHRVKVGDSVRVGLLNDNMGIGEIISLTESEAVLDVSLDTPPPPPLPLTLILGLPRPKSFRKVVHSATELGIKHIVLLRTRRVERSYWQSPVLFPENIEDLLMLGLEQARDTIMPKIEKRKRFKWFVEDNLPQLMAGTRALVAHPRASCPCPRDISQPVTLAVGPEGGFVPYEIDMLEANGFESITIGPRVLRVENAVPAIVSKLF